MIILLVIVVVGILLVYGVAYLIINRVPKKLHWIISVVLLVLIVLLSKMIVDAIMKPIHFNEEKIKRYTKVIDKLKIVRDAEIAYQQVHGTFTNDKNALVALVEKDSFAIERPKTVVKKIHRGGGIYIDKEVRVVDTIGWKPVRAEFAGKDYKNMFNLSDLGTAIELKTDTIEKVEGVKSWVFRARVAKEAVLKGMDADLIKQEKRAPGGTEVKGEYLEVGSLEDVKTNGNWPPFYDSKDKKNKK